MMKLTKKLHKDQRGLTLIELLAVIVILAIIAAIAIPSVNSIIKNSEARAQVENAKLIISTARLAVADKSINGIGTKDGVDQLNPTNLDENPKTGFKRTKVKITLKELFDKGYLEKSVVDPTTRKDYDQDKSFVLVIMDEKEGEPGNYEVQWYYAITLAPEGASSEKDYYYNLTLESELAGGSGSGSGNENE